MLTIQDAQAMSISNTNLSTTSPYSTSTPPHTTTTPPFTTTPPTTTTPPPPPTTTPSNLCDLGGYYRPRNTTIAEVLDVNKNECRYVFIDENCNFVEWDQPNCRTPAPMCDLDGYHGPRNTTIAEGYDRSGNVCRYVYADEKCNQVEVILHDCGLCSIDGRLYSPGSDIEKGYNVANNRCDDPYVDENCNVRCYCVFKGVRIRVGESVYRLCWGAWCTESGMGAFDHCGCFLAEPYNYYPPGTSIITDSRGCAGIFCENNYTWTPWNNCPPNTTTPPEIFTTTPDITPSTTTPLTTSPSSLCQFNGHALDIGETIPTDDRWCSGVTCTETGIVQWDYFNCTGTTTPEDLPTTPTTTDRTTTPAMTTNNPNQIKKMQLKEMMKENVKKKLESWVKMKANKEITRKEFLKIKQKLKNRMKKKLTKKIQKMKKKQKMKSKKKN